MYSLLLSVMYMYILLVSVVYMYILLVVFDLPLHLTG